MDGKPRISYTSPRIGYWDIPGVVYKGETGTYRLLEHMTLPMTQYEHAEFYEKAKTKGDFHQGNSALTFAIPRAVCNLGLEGSQEIEGLRQFLQAGFRRSPSVLTNILYSKTGEDMIIHNCKTSDEYSAKVGVVGPSGPISDKDLVVLGALFGTRDHSEISRVFRWIGGPNSTLWRLDSSPIDDWDERGVGFGVGSIESGLDCTRDLLERRPSFLLMRIA